MIADRDYFVVALLLCIALALGGAGYYYPRLALCIELAALGTIAYFALTQRSWHFDRLTLFAFAIAGGAFLLPLLQLVPLPSAVWHALPGRAFAMKLDAELGWSQKWRPLSLDPEATVQSVILLLPPLAMLLGVRLLDLQQRLKLLRLLVLFGLASALVGTVQYVTGGKLTPFPSAHLGYPIGLFVNRNHQAALLLIVIPLTFAIGSLRSREAGPPAARVILILAACAILSVVVLATSSRMGAALLVLSVGVALSLLFVDQRLWRFVAPTLVGLGLLSIVVFESGPFSRVLARFSSLEDARFGYWRDVSFALRNFGLTGTGLGTFVPTYQSVESLQHVSASYLNHAHNDYLELALEGGIPALVLFGLFAVFLAIAMKSSSKPEGSSNRRLLTAGVSCGIIVILVFSLVDYPLRMPALSTTFALLCGFLLPARRQESPDQLLLAGGRRRRRRRPRSRYAVAAVAFLLGWVLLACANSSADILDQRYPSAIQWAPWSASAYAAEADEALSHQQLRRAGTYATAALSISPIKVSAIRTLGIIDLASGFENTGNQLMLTAAGLGWRDAVTQLWAVQVSLETNEPAKAAQRMEALLQQGDLPSSIVTVLTGPNSSPALRELALALSRNPSARAAVLKLAGQAEPSEFGVFEQLLRRMSLTTRPPTTTEIEPFLQRVLQSRDFAQAQRIWAIPRGATLVANGGFDAASPSTQHPSGWSISSGRGAAVIVEAPARPLQGNALKVYQPGLTTSTVAQVLLLPPGRYSINYAVRGLQGTAAEVWPKIGCVPTKTKPDIQTRVGPSAGDWHVYQFSFAVPQWDCPVQRLSLAVSNRLGTPTTTWIDDVRVIPVWGGKLL